MGLDRLIVIGGGNMARAILGGAIARGVVRGSGISVVEPDADRLKYFQDQGAQGFSDAGAIRDRLTPDAIVLLAVKPQMLARVSESIGVGQQGAGGGGFEGLVISILAGITSDRVGSALGARCRVVRVMPNTPALLGMGVTGLCPGAGSNDDDVTLAESLFQGVGKVVRVGESDMDAVTAVSGSGPAYVFLLAQAMIEGGVAAGLDHAVARMLTLETLRGGAEMLVTSRDTPEQLRRAVTSPGGTTQAAITEMERCGFRPCVERAILAARDRGIELGAGG